MSRRISDVSVNRVMCQGDPMTLVNRFQISPRKEREQKIEKHDRLSKERLIEELSEVSGFRDRQMEGLFG